MACLSDTNVWISLLKHPGAKIETRFRSVVASDIFLCSVVKAELWHGAKKYGNPERRHQALEQLFAPFVSLSFDDQTARHYADIRHDLEIRGLGIGPNDLKIAAVARAHGLTLVSADDGFRHVPGLTVEDWTQG